MEVRHYEITEDMAQRLNIVKFFLIVMVVLIHAEMPLDMNMQVPEYMTVCKNVIKDGICAIAVPSFFFISGFLLFSKEFTWRGNLKKKIRSMLLPYFLINSFWIIFFKGIRLFEFTKHFFLDEAYQIDGIKKILEAYLNPMPLYYPFWFLRDLIILNIFAKGIQIVIDKLPIISFGVMLAVCLNIIHIPILFSNSSLFMFSLSYYLIKYKWDIMRLNKIKCMYLGLVFCGFIFVKLWICDLGVVTLIYELTGLSFFYQLAGKIRKGRLCKPILWCSQFTFFIYAFHEFYEAMLKKIVMTVFPQYGYVQLMEFFMIPIFIVAMCIVVGAVMKKWVPAVYCLICGYR